jgi:hypothetical protein
MTEAKKSMIDKLLSNASDAIEAAKRPFIKKKVKRSIESAIENAEEQRVDACIELETQRGRLITHPKEMQTTLNIIVELRQKKKACLLTIAELEKEKEELYKEV